VTAHILDGPSGLTRRARSFLHAHAARVRSWTAEQHQQHWTDLGRPKLAVDQLIAHQRRWGGLVLPPAACYEGGPFGLDADDPDLDEDRLVFTVGRPRYSVPYGYAVDTDGRFGICGSGYPWVPLHASVDGWVEALALTYAARDTARLVRRITGPAADKLIADLDGQAPLPEVAGIADNWWRTSDALVATYRGESLFFGGRTSAMVLVYEGLNIDAI
jgi:hypothetical protein